MLGRHFLSCKTSSVNSIPGIPWYVAFAFMAVFTSLVLIGFEFGVGWAEAEVNNVLCGQFDADFVYSATGKPIYKVEKASGAQTMGCQYYTRYEPDYYKLDSGHYGPGGPFIAIGLENRSVDTQKKGAKMFGRRVSTDPRIKMDHLIITQNKNNVIWSIDLIINPTRYIWTNQRDGALTNEELVEFAARMADRLQGRETLEIRKNPVESAITDDHGPGKTGDDQAGDQSAVVKGFLGLIGDHHPDRAVAMMDANEQTKAMWVTNFKTIKSLKIKSVRPVYEDEWTKEDQVFKVELDVKLASGTPSYGWTNGRNHRWVRLKNINGQWLVHELANNP